MKKSARIKHFFSFYLLTFILYNTKQGVDVMQKDLTKGSALKKYYYFLITIFTC